MRLIDADRLLQHTKFYNLKNGNRAIDEIDILHAPTVKAIPLDHIRQVREEMKGKSFTEEIFDEDIFNSTNTESVSTETAKCESYIETEVVKLSDVLEILDKLIESEGIDGNI